MPRRRMVQMALVRYRYVLSTVPPLSLLLAGKNRSAVTGLTKAGERRHRQRDR